MGEREQKNKRAMFLSVRLKVFIPQAICPVAKTLRKILSYMKITSVSGLAKIQQISCEKA